MYTNPSNIIKTLIRMLQTNKENVDCVIRVYEPSKQLTILEGMRKTLPADSFPSLEIEPTTGSNNWYATRAQMPRYSFECTLTVLNSNEQYGVEYISTVASAVIEIMSDPQNLQLRVMNEVRWDPNIGLCDTYITDSLVENATYNALKDGTVRTCTFDWFAMIHEPFPDSHFWIFFANAPEPVTVRPREKIIPPA